MEKKCNKCNVTKLLIAFKQKTNICKECANIELKIWRSKNKEKSATYCAKYRANNKEKISTMKAIYRANNKEKIAKLDAIYYQNNKEKKIEIARAWYVNNKERAAKRKSIYYENNKEKMLAASVIWNKNNKKKMSNKRLNNSLTLNDTYIKCVINNATNLKYSDIPKKLIEAKRIELKLNRLIKEIKSENIVRY